MKLKAKTRPQISIASKVARMFSAILSGENRFSEVTMSFCLLTIAAFMMFSDLSPSGIRKVQSSNIAFHLMISIVLAMSSVLYLRGSEVHQKKRVWETEDHDRCYSMIIICVSSLGNILNLFRFAQRNLFHSVAFACQALGLLWFLISFIPGGPEILHSISKGLLGMVTKKFFKSN